MQAFFHVHDFDRAGKLVHDLTMLAWPPFFYDVDGAGTLPVDIIKSFEVLASCKDLWMAG